jgi:4-carboxymuconolactone decarboxylase
MNSQNQEQIFPIGERGSADWFSGEVYVQPLVSPAEMENLYTVGNVTFEPSARTNWHTHPIGQTLLVIEGKGWYQEKGKTAQPLTKGSVVAIPKDVEHWHGAAKDNRMVHIAITNVAYGNMVRWLLPVTNEEYDAVNQ